MLRRCSRLQDPLKVCGEDGKGHAETFFTVRGESGADVGDCLKDVEAISGRVQVCCMAGSSRRRFAFDAEACRLCWLCTAAELRGET